MGPYLGDHILGAKVRFGFSTNNAAGGRVAPSDAWEVADMRVYKNGGTTERASTAGFGLTSAFDSMTGMTYGEVDTNDNTDAGFFVAGADYMVAIYPDTETVDSQSVSAWVGFFSIENRNTARANILGPFPMKYGVATPTQPKLRVTVPKIGGGLAISNTDWTPATGDVKVSIDGGAEANIDTGGGALPAWANNGLDLSFLAAQLQGKRIVVRIVDAQPKVIQDTFIVIETYGDVNALYPDDVSSSGLTAAALAQQLLQSVG